MGTDNQVNWQFFSDGKWHRGTTAKNHRKNTEEAGYLVRDTFPLPIGFVAAPTEQVAKAVSGSIFDGRSDVVGAVGMVNAAMLGSSGVAPAGAARDCGDALEYAGWQFFDAGWHWGDDKIRNHLENTANAGYAIRFMFAVKTEEVEV